MRVLMVLMVLLVPLSARAATDDEIFAVYARGDYEQAARMGEAARTAPALATAARAVLADDVLREQPCLACLERAESLARQAVADDPHFALGQVWLAVALGYQARIIGAVKARMKNMPAQSRAALDLAVADDPTNAFAVSALGGWHIEVVRGGGATLAAGSGGGAGAITSASQDTFAGHHCHTPNEITRVRTVGTHAVRSTSTWRLRSRSGGPHLLRTSSAVIWLVC